MGTGGLSLSTVDGGAWDAGGAIETPPAAVGMAEARGAEVGESAKDTSLCTLLPASAAGLLLLSEMAVLAAGRAVEGALVRDTSESAKQKAKL